MGRFDEAKELFELAIAQNRSTGSAPWVARSQYDYAKMLVQQGNRADRDRVAALLTESQRAANEMGMVRLKLQIADLKTQL